MPQLSDGQKFPEPGPVDDRRRLKKEEVEPFLSWLFGGLAQRAEPLRPLETMKVARYLRLLADHGVPRGILARGKEAITGYRRSDREDQQWRDAVNRAADMLLSKLLIYGEVVPCKGQDALRFFKEHQVTYLASPVYKPAFEFLKSYGLAPDVSATPNRPCLLSASLNAQGQGNAYLQTDLSERIHAALHALRLSGIRRARKKIVHCLNEIPLPPLRRGTDSGGWTYERVNDRARRFEKAHLAGIKKGSTVAQTKERMDEFRWEQVQRWLLYFRVAQSLALQNLASICSSLKSKEGTPRQRVLYAVEFIGFRPSGFDPVPGLRRGLDDFLASFGLGSADTQGVLQGMAETRVREAIQQLRAICTRFLTREP